MRAVVSKSGSISWSGVVFIVIMDLSGARDRPAGAGRRRRDRAHGD
jgi:hypothetical protein